MADPRDLTDKSTEELAIILAAATTNAAHVIVIVDDIPYKMTIAQLDTLIS